MRQLTIDLRVRCVALLVALIIASCSLASETLAQATPAKQTNKPSGLKAMGRDGLSLAEGWRFAPTNVKGAERLRFDDSKWERVSIPHTWNAEDTHDDVPDYRMGIGWYRRNLDIDTPSKGQKIILYFEGANQVADVFINGNFLGQHKGGYTAFAFDITNHLVFNLPGFQNVLSVKVDNSINPNIPPHPSADFNLYGGIYRDVWLVMTDAVHFDMLDSASTGVYVETPTVAADSATVRVRGSVTNETAQPRNIRIVSTVFDAKGLQVTQLESAVKVEARRQASFQQTSQPILQPQLWSPDNPYLYTIVTELKDGKKISDTVHNPLGFRWFSFDAEKGFSLNGKPFKLRGANRHQDYIGRGNAVPNDLQVKDLQLIKELGFNCVLLAHYPQDPAVLEAADRLGLIVWEEIPVLRQISTTKEFADNCKTMLTEMIRQHYNHPSVMMWCYMNEIFLRMRHEPNYVEKVVALAKELETLARREDPARVTVISANRNELYNTSGMADIPQVFAWHMYFGWYYGEFPELGQFLDEQHRRFPKRKIMVSEYGADSDGRTHSLKPARGDYSTEWAQAYHQSYLAQMESRPYLCGAAVWNAFDFGSEARGESTPHLNKKGLFTFDRQPKDISYFYKASFAKDPVLHLATREWSRRTGVNPEAKTEGSLPFVKQAVQVYSNLPEAELFVNGKTLGTKQFGGARAATWDVPFRDGLNVLEVRGQAGNRLVSDRAEVQFVYRPPTLADTSSSFTQLAVNVGATSQFTDETGLTWEADQPYAPGGWGYVGGEPDKTDQNIRGTTDDPLYRTLRKGLQSYRFDVPDGNYEIELRFAEARFTKPGAHVFSVSANGKAVIENFDPVKEAGPFRAISRTIRISTSNGRGVEFQFQAVSGDAVLSAIRIRRIL